MASAEDMEIAKQLIAKQLLSRAEVQRHLDELDDLLKAGEKTSLAELLCKENRLSAQEIACLKQKKRIVHCGKCRSQYRVREEDVGTKFKCKKCGAMLVIPPAGGAVSPAMKEEAEEKHVDDEGTLTSEANRQSLSMETQNASQEEEMPFSLVDTLSFPLEETAEEKYVDEKTQPPQDLGMEKRPVSQEEEMPFSLTDTVSFGVVYDLETPAPKEPGEKREEAECGMEEVLPGLSPEEGSLGIKIDAFEDEPSLESESAPLPLSPGPGLPSEETSPGEPLSPETIAPSGRYEAPAQYEAPSYAKPYSPKILWKSLQKIGEKDQKALLKYFSSVAMQALIAENQGNKPQSSGILWNSLKAVAEKDERALLNFFSPVAIEKIIEEALSL